MKHLEVSSERTKKPQKTRKEIKKELEESMVYSKKHGNTEIEEKANMVERSEDAVKSFKILRKS